MRSFPEVLSFLATTPKNVIRLAPLEVDEIHIRFFPANTIGGGSVENRHFPEFWRPVLFGLSLGNGHSGGRFILYERAVPAFVDLFFLVVDDVAIKIIKSLLPGFILTEERIVWVFLGSAYG